MSRHVGFALLLSVCFAGVNQVFAAIIPIDISSPAVGFAGGIPLTDTNYYTAIRDRRPGLHHLNETGQSARGRGHGNRVGASILVDTVTRILTFDFAYGAAFGLPNNSRDLASDFTAVQIHKGVSKFPSGGVIHDLISDHAPGLTQAGQVTGPMVLTAAQLVELFENKMHINVHSFNLPAGEIRGRLIPVLDPSPFLLTLMLGVFGLFGMTVFVCNHHHRLAI